MSKYKVFIVSYPDKECDFFSCVCVMKGNMKCVYVSTRGEEVVPYQLIIELVSDNVLLSWYKRKFKRIDEKTISISNNYDDSTVNCEIIDTYEINIYEELLTID